MHTLETAAHEQLFTRPDEEHFASFEDLRQSAAQQRARSREIDVRDADILFGAQDVHLGETSLRPTHYALAQLAGMARVPMHVLERVNPGTRASLLNQCFDRGRRHRLALADGDRLRAFTSDRYERVWDDELYELLDRWLLPSGFIPAVPTNGDTTNARGNTKPALFRSDRDSFCFFYGEESRGEEFGGLRKGVVAWNSEVGAKSLGFATFLFRDACSNFVIWGMDQVTERSARHTGGVRDLVAEFDSELRRISSEVQGYELEFIDAAARTRFAPENDPAQAISRLKQFRVPAKLLPQVVDAVYLPENPGELTVWGVVNGLTTVARRQPYAEDRVALSRVAGELLSVR